MTEHAVSSLRDLVFTTETVPVIDDLAALDWLLPEMPVALECHAALLERLLPLLDLRGRALVRAREHEGFLAPVEIALGVGRCIARQGPPFGMVIGGVDL